MNNFPAFNQLVHGFQNIGIPNPAPNMGFVYEVPVGLIISPTTVSLSLDTASISVTRCLEIDITAGAGNIYTFRDFTMIDDDLVVAISLAANATRVHPNTTSETIVLPFPANVFLVPGDQFSLLLFGGAAADQMGSIILQARTWIIPA